MHLEMLKVSMGSLVDILSLTADKPVVDQFTQLKRNYHLSLELPTRRLIAMMRSRAGDDFGVPMPVRQASTGGGER